KLALGKVYDAARLVNDHKSQGDQGIDAADDYAVDCQLQKKVHQAASTIGHTANLVWMREVRPSWNLIVVSIATSNRSLYRAPMISAYRSSTNRRLTFRVRVSSSSSASSSLYSNTNFRIRAASGSVSFTFSISFFKSS